MTTEMFTRVDDKRAWFIVDAEGKTLGRLATRVARVLLGKHRPDYTPNADTGDFVVVVNAEKVHLTGKKLTDKVYYRHSQYPGCLRARTAGNILAAHPERLIEGAVRGMLPLNRLRPKRMKRLRVFAGADHTHAAQNPQPLKDVR